jgi:hypothetical protein
MTGQQLAASTMHGQHAIGPLKYVANSTVQKSKVKKDAKTEVFNLLEGNLKVAFLPRRSTW